MRRRRHSSQPVQQLPKQEQDGKQRLVSKEVSDTDILTLTRVRGTSAATARDCDARLCEGVEPLPCLHRISHDPLRLLVRVYQPIPFVAVKYVPAMTEIMFTLQA